MLTFAQAIDQLRPEFARCDHIILELQSPMIHGTYFATIPRDVINILLPLLNMRKQNYTLQELQENYKKHKRTLQITELWKSMNNITGSSMIIAKNVHDSLVIKPTVAAAFHYAGGDNYVVRSSTDPNFYIVKDINKWAETGEYYQCLPDPYYNILAVLPCGLIYVVFPTNIQKAPIHPDIRYTLMDISDHKTAIDVPKIPSKNSRLMIDDYGDISYIDKQHTMLLEFSDQSSIFPIIRLS